MRLSNKHFFLAAIFGGLLLGAGVHYVTKPATGGLKTVTNWRVPAWPSLTGKASPGNMASFHDAVVSALPAVVSIYTEQVAPVAGRTKDPLFSQLFGDNGRFPVSQVQTNQGSGVIYSADGYIITNEHLLLNADRISVSLSNGKRFEAEKVGADMATDLAVLKIDSDDALPHISVPTDYTSRVGDVVLAIGNPYDFGQTVTMGIVSATGRGNITDTPLQDFIQIDAAINPGNSGGPLINPAGELVGINTAIYAPDSGAQGIGFAVPTRMVNYVIPQIIEQMSVKRGWLGLQVDDLHYYPDLAARHNFGAVVTGVFQNSPAEQVGLRRGDVITHLAEHPISGAKQLILRTSTTRPGTEVTVRGRRQSEKFTLRAELAERPR
ncbi:MAG TPA: transcriptional regulator [Gammaproteobacteria bacterium]|nr:transcriptional regulator [Gammaproteobacteria bacterium]